MTNDILQKRFMDLANRCARSSRYTYTNFLSLADQSDFFQLEKEVSFVKWEAEGGSEFAERKIIRFGSVEELGYEEPFPIVCLVLRPVNRKFSDELTHRDVLGALMNLGIERETLGDIFITENESYVYCRESVSEYIIDNLCSVKHTTIVASVYEGKFELPEASKEEMTVQVSSERVDAVVARVFKLSRDAAVELFRQQKVFVNSRLPFGNDAKVKAGDRISVRGFGRFDICGDAGVSRKGKINVKVLVYK